MANPNKNTLYLNYSKGANYVNINFLYIVANYTIKFITTKEVVLLPVPKGLLEY